MLDLLRLCRPQYAVPMALTYTLTLYYAAGGRLAPNAAEAAAATAALMLVIAAGYALNDAFDYPADRRNAPRRPVASGRVSRRVAAGAAACLAAGGLCVAVLAGGRFLAALSVLAAALAVYDATSKRIGALKAPFVAALMTSLYPLALVQARGATGPRAGCLAFFAAWMFLTSLGYELLKDLRDAPGDPAVGGRPSHLARRPLLWRRISSAAVVLGALLLVGPALSGCKWLYSAIVAPAMLAALAAARLTDRQALRVIYAECVIVGVAAAGDALVLGF